MEESKKRFLDYFEASLQNNWDAPALDDFDSPVALTYGQLAEQIARLHVLYETVGLEKGDKIALCGRNSSMWAVNFLAATTYGCVAVAILADFDTAAIHALVNHSDAKLLMVGPMVWSNVTSSEMPNLKGILSIEDLKLLEARSEQFATHYAEWEQHFAAKYPNGFTRNDVQFERFDVNAPVLINYTSGSTGAPKGVMLSWRSIDSNIRFSQEKIPNSSADTLLSMLPMAHMYGMAFEFLYEFIKGCHVYFLTRVPSPQIIFNALAEVKPRIIVAVPLIIEKIIRKKVMPKLETPSMKLLLKLPYISNVIKNKVRQTMIDAFGGNFMEVIVGGAAFNQEVEKLLKDIQFPYTVGYGMTECGPIICYEDWRKFAMASCGKAAPRMEVKVLSPDPQNIVGEIVCKGPNVMLGYFKNEKATAQVIDAEGWLHTGDLGIIDAEGNVFIKGRSKNMLLGPSGQNIYPEEIEDKLNNMPFVAESIVVQRNDKLVGLVYPDFDEAFKQGVKDEALIQLMEQNRLEVNKLLPAYEQITAIEIYQEEFEKTPKKSIKRFMYK